MTLPWFPIAVSFLATFCPHPHDKEGWALRVRLLDSRQPYMVGEYLQRRNDVPHPRLLVALGNHAKADRKYLLLKAANACGRLPVFIDRPDGTPLPAIYNPRMKLLFDDRWDLAAGKWDSCDFDFGELDYGCGLMDVGFYKLHAGLRTDEGYIVSPQIKFKVIEPAADAILASHPVALEGYEAKWRKENQQRPIVQQIQVEGRTWLVYRRYVSPKDGGKAYFTQRLAELPGKVDVKVEGAFGDSNPLTITYKDPTSKTGLTKHVINSVDGLPWTEEEELWRIERNKKRDIPPTPIKP
jgi:hypothetical protein